MGLINRIAFTFANIHGQRFFMIYDIGVVGITTMPHEILDERIGTSGMVGWIRQRQDIFIRPKREPFDFPKLGHLLMVDSLRPEHHAVQGFA
jgi:hypothetical protein